MSNFDKYDKISNNYASSATRNISRQIVIDNRGGPKAVGLWGRLVRFLASLGKTDSQRKKIYEAAIGNFRKALNEQFQEEAFTAANFFLSKVGLENRSLRASDVHDAIVAADNSNKIKALADAADNAIRQNISHQK